MNEKREGFWWSKREPDLPKPKEREKPWKGQREFLALLQQVQAKTRAAHYRGWSTCRICGQKNGSTEYKRNGWVWPGGFYHYVKDHNVKPSDAFITFVTEQADLQEEMAKKLNKHQQKDQSKNDQK